jgi:type VI secretion system protein VasD
MSIRGSLVCCVSFTVWLAGCAAKPPPLPQPAETKTVISAGADANPDASGRPSPVVVRVYQLRGDAEFNGAGYFALYDKEKETLGPSLIMRDQKTVLPGQALDFKLSLSPDARFLGVIAGFRDIQASHWRALAEVPPKPKSKKPVERTVNVRIEKDTINVSITN